MPTNKEIRPFVLLAIGIVAVLIFTAIVRSIPSYVACWLIEGIIAIALKPKGGKGFWNFQGHARTKVFAFAFTVTVLLLSILGPIALSPMMEPYLANSMVDFAIGIIMTIGVWIDVNKMFKH
ncbi:MAG TPA: hypothetical protein VKM55_29575 [Candidatus Lokiarchaeia archaeon]|nr:hypothetical protein [Candidatus Lokiarchaeia archaeon]